MLIKALKDLDWEVKEAALGCLGYMLDVVINDCPLGGIEEFVKTLNIYGIVDALILSTQDYERRFLHKTYAILHKLHGFLSSNFHSDELKHNCNPTCDEKYDQLADKEGSSCSKPTYTHGSIDSKCNKRDLITSTILEEDHYQVLVKKFKPNTQTLESKNQNEEKSDQEAFSKINESSSHIRGKDAAVHCIYSFIHLVRFDIQFDMKLKEFDTYCKERNNLENVLDDIISSIGEDNVIDGIDCF